MAKKDWHDNARTCVRVHMYTRISRGYRHICKIGRHTCRRESWLRTWGASRKLELHEARNIRKKTHRGTRWIESRRGVCMYVHSSVTVTTSQITHAHILLNFRDWYNFFSIRIQKFTQISKCIIEIVYMTKDKIWEKFARLHRGVSTGNVKEKLAESKDYQVIMTIGW